MFDIGWMELLLIGVVALIVVGPKDLPRLFRTVGQVMGKARGMAREFQRSMEQAADESGLREAARELNSVNKLNLKNPTKSARKYAEGLVTEGHKPSGTEKAGAGASAEASATPKVRAQATAADVPAAPLPAGGAEAGRTDGERQ